jgi:hypothetical protein
MAASSKPAQKIGRFEVHFWDRSEKERIEELIEQIVRRLREYPRDDRSEADVRNFVVIACATMMSAGASQRIQKDHRTAPGVPSEVSKRLKRIRELSKQLLAELGGSPLQLDLLLFRENRVLLLSREATQAFLTDEVRFETDSKTGDKVLKAHRIEVDPEYREEWGARDRFVKQLKRITRTNFKAPHFNSDLVKDLSAEMAKRAISHCSSFVPKNTRKSPRGVLTSLFYEVACPSSDGELADLKRARAKVS